MHLFCISNDWYIVYSDAHTSFFWWRINCVDLTLGDSKLIASPEPIFPIEESGLPLISCNLFKNGWILVQIQKRMTPNCQNSNSAVQFYLDRWGGTKHGTIAILIVSHQKCIFVHQNIIVNAISEIWLVHFVHLGLGCLQKTQKKRPNESFWELSSELSPLSKTFTNTFPTIVDPDSLRLEKAKWED